MAENPSEMIFLSIFISALFALDPDPAGRHNLTYAESDSIDGSMVIRTEDLFWQTGIDFSSLDRMSQKLHDRYYGFYGPQPLLILDGIPFDAEFLGVVYSQYFPVPNAQAKTISNRPGSGLLYGLPYRSGYYNLQSNDLKPGLSLNYFGQIGHNSGEPGPWIFDPERVSPNIERFGPWIEAEAAYKAGSWYAKALLKHHNYFYPADPRPPGGR